MNFDAIELNIVGNWSGSSKSPDRYGRIVCDNELLLRNAIVQNVAAGRNLSPSIRLLETAQWKPHRHGDRTHRRLARRARTGTYDPGSNGIRIANQWALRRWILAVLGTEQHANQPRL